MKFGYKSKRELCLPGAYVVHPYLVICATEALQHCASLDLDFTIFDGGRTVAEQRENIARGVSKTIRSRHIPDGAGLCYAVDLVPYIGGRVMWDSKTPSIQKQIDVTFSAIEHGMKTAAKKHFIDLQWGYDLWGWDKPHWQLSRKPHPAMQNLALAA